MPTTSYGAATTAAEIVTDVDLHGRRAIVTGASSGIGVETARALASANAEVTLAVRDLAAGQRTAADITAATGNSAVYARRLDLADQDSIAAFSAGWTGPLHLLVNNAGVMALPDLQLTPAGWELQFAVNHLGTSRSRSACTTPSPPPGVPGSLLRLPRHREALRHDFRWSHLDLGTHEAGLLAAGLPAAIRRQHQR